MSRDQVGWGQKVTRGPKKFKGKKDIAYRMMILDEKAEHRQTHYINGEYMVCLQQGCPACKASLRRSDRYGFNILVYEITPDLQVQQPISYQILPWIVGYKMMDALGKMFNMWGSFWNYDILATCAIEQYQEFTVQNMPEAVWEKVPGLKETIIKDYQTKGLDVGPIMGKVATAAEMLEQMGKPNPFADRDNTPQQNTGARTARQFTPKQDKGLFGGGAQQVSQLVGGVVDASLASAKTAPPHVLPGSAPAAAPAAAPARATTEIHGSTAPKSATPPPFPAPASAMDAPAVLAVADTPPVAAKDAPASPGFSDLVTRLKGLAKPPNESPTKV